MPRLPAGSGENLDAEVASELVGLLLEQTPEFLEKAVLQLLVARGYGGSEGVAQHLGGPGDGGFDVVNNQDRPGIGTGLRTSEALRA